MAELDTKQQVLVAIYLEYQKDLPQMDNISADNLSLDNDAFKVAIMKLENEGLIHGVKTAKGGRGSVPYVVFTSHIMMTPIGIDYVEQKLEIQPTMSSGEKAKEVTKKVSSWGYNELKDFSAKFLAELLKGSLGSQIKGG